MQKLPKYTFFDISAHLPWGKKLHPKCSELQGSKCSELQGSKPARNSTFKDYCSQSNSSQLKKNKENKQTNNERETCKPVLSSSEHNTSVAMLSVCTHTHGIQIDTPVPTNKHLWVSHDD